MNETDLKNLVQEFLEKTSFSFVDVTVTLDMDDGSYWIAVRTNDSRHLIGHNGEMIQTINHLIKRILETKHKELAPRVTVDVNGYQKERIDKIKTTAHMMAERARFFKSKIELEPMNAYERRIVHDFVSKHPDLTSESTGTGLNRRVVIFFKQPI
jgi:spoIIIJ-associated protein